MVQTQGVRQLSYIQAVNEALRQEMQRDESVIIMGEDIAGGGEREDFQDAWGGPMRLTKGLVGEFGRRRIRDTPIAEAGFIGAGVGAAATGLRPVVVAWLFILDPVGSFNAFLGAIPCALGYAERGQQGTCYRQ